MVTRNLYKGFSTQEFETNKSLVLRDVELVKRDLLNHIFTRRGERVKMPTYGTVIPDIIFDPLDEQTIEIIEQDLLTVVDFDPRVTLRSINIVPLFDDNALVASLDLDYVELDLNDILEIRLEFER